MPRNQTNTYYTFQKRWLWVCSWLKHGTESTSSIWLFVVGTRWCAILGLWESAIYSMPCTPSPWITASLRSTLVSHAVLHLLPKLLGLFHCFCGLFCVYYAVSFYLLLRGPEQLNGSVLGLLSCLMPHRGFSPPIRRIFPVEGIFPLGLTWVLTLFPPKLFRMRV